MDSRQDLRINGQFFSIGVAIGMHMRGISMIITGNLISNFSDL